MKCNLEKPRACFNCPYTDCLDSTYSPNYEERAWLHRAIPDKKEHRKDRFINGENITTDITHKSQCLMGIRGRKAVNA